MQMRLTNGKSLIVVPFHATLDAKDIADIRESKRPVTKALKLSLKRLGVDEGLWPAPGVALEGL